MGNGSSPGLAALAILRAVFADYVAWHDPVEERTPIERYPLATARTAYGSLTLVSSGITAIAIDAVVPRVIAQRSCGAGCEILGAGIDGDCTSHTVGSSGTEWPTIDVLGVSEGKFRNEPVAR